MTARTWTAAKLPAGSVVAVGRDVYIKRIIHAGTPWHEEFWTGAMTYAVPADNSVMQAEMNRGTTTILRVGDGTSTAALRHDFDRALAAALPKTSLRIATLIGQIQAMLAEVDADREKFNRKNTDA